MSGINSDKKTIILKHMPIILKRQKLSILKKENLINIERSRGGFKPALIKPTHTREDVIYESKTGDFFKAEFQKITILNRCNLLTNSSRTVAKCITHSGVFVEKTSDSITKVIGQTNYDTVFSGLCSVISQEHRIRGILALLTENIKVYKNLVTDPNDSHKGKPVTTNASCQTQETQIDDVFIKPKRRIKRQQLAPYVVTGTVSEQKKKLTKAIIQVDYNKVKQEKSVLESKHKDTVTAEQVIGYDVSKNLVKDETRCNKNENMEILPELSLDFDYSNDSVGRFSSLSIDTTPELLNEPNSLIQNVDRYTRHNDVLTEPETARLLPYHVLTLYDNSTLLLPEKPEDDFHIASKENLKLLNEKDRRKLVLYQAYIDFKYCMSPDEDGHLPLHYAVLNDDIDLLRRQCFVLNIRNTSLDTLANGLTALQISMFKDTGQYTAILLQYGADPFFTDENGHTCLHLAAELPSDHLTTVIRHCTNNARNILENEDLWKPEFESKSNEELSRYLLTHMSRICDNQGYTPLMLASKLGLYDNVKQLVDICPNCINMPMPTCGNTAMYLAVGAACTDAADRGKKSKVRDNFKKTIEILIENGSDPSFENHTGSSVNLLVTEFNNGELSMLIGNKLTLANFPNHFSGKNPSGAKNFDCFMIVKDEDGNDNIQEINLENRKNKVTAPAFGNSLKKGKRVIIDITKPKIIQNLLLSKSCSPVEIEKNKVEIKKEISSTSELQDRVVDTKRFVITSKITRGINSDSTESRSLLIPKIATTNPVESSPCKRKATYTPKKNIKLMKNN